ncbi:MAG: isoaspartyl peptidase/L-asparaginase family protein [Nitrospiraceae bacterium]
MRDRSRIRAIGPGPHAGSHVPQSERYSSELNPSRPLILVHGGAGLRAMNRSQAACLSEALVTGYEELQRGASSLVAVERAIRTLEASGLFNAGIGSRRQLDDVRRMDASLMEGHGLTAGAVASIEGIVHPITAARLVMEHTDHVLLVGKPATVFVQGFGLERQPRGTRSTARKRRAQTISLPTFRPHQRGETRGRETVGAVAVDQNGTVAAGASTGGIDRMLPGRVGDTPLIGCGVYADDEAGAVSMTGSGESIIRLAVAKEIVDRLALGASPRVAARIVLKKVVARVCGAAGALILSSDGRFAVRHTTRHMSAGYWNGRGKPIVADKFR